MATMYRVRRAKIEAFEVLRTTARQVVLPSPHRKGGEEREAKETDWHPGTKRGKPPTAELLPTRRRRWMA